MTDLEFEAAYQELLAEHISGDCPEDCAFCEEDRQPLVVEGMRPRQPDNHEYRLTFGKHKGKELNQVPRDYLFYVLGLPGKCGKKQAWMRDAKSSIRNYLDRT